MAPSTLGLRYWRVLGRAGDGKRRRRCAQDRAAPAKTYLNFVIDDDATHTAGSATFTGTVTLTWINLGN